MLKKCSGYPFKEFEDSLLFDITVNGYPKIDIIKQVKRKIVWWKEHPDAIKSDPRKQLENWFKDEADFQKRGGPQLIGQIMKEVSDPDHRNFFKKLID